MDIVGVNGEVVNGFQWLIMGVRLSVINRNQS